VSRHGDPATAEGGASFRDTLLVGARINLETDGHIAPVCLMVARRDPQTLVPFAAPRLVVVGLGLPLADEQSKEVFARTIAEASVRSNALAAALIIEAWFTTGTAEDVQAALDWKAEHGSLAEFPGRWEVVRVTWEHVEMGVEQWTAPIIRDGDRVTCGEFECDTRQGVWFGRFAQLLAPSAYGASGTEA